MSAASIAFNTNLAAQLAMLDAVLAAEITLFDTDAAFQQMLANPASFGLTNTTGQCVQNLQNGLCNPDEWLFWDGVHPTARTHEILARQIRLRVDPGTGNARATGSGLDRPGAFIRRR